MLKYRPKQYNLDTMEVELVKRYNLNPIGRKMTTRIEDEWNVASKSDVSIFTSSPIIEKMCRTYFVLGAFAGTKETVDILETHGGSPVIITARKDLQKMVDEHHSFVSKE